MKSDLFKKILLAIAAILLIVIWSRNLLLFLPKSEDSRGAVSDTRTQPADKVAGESSERDTRFEFPQDVRDPFQMPAVKKPTADSTRRRLPKPPPEPPHASLIGIVWNTTSPHVVVYDSLTQASVILKRQEWINGYQVRSIDKKQVVLRSKQQRFVWSADE